MQIINVVDVCRKPKLTGQIFFGGSVQAGGPVTVTKDKELSVRY